MLIVSFAVGLAVLILSGGTDLSMVFIAAGAGALAGTITELFSPSEYDTITVPVIITFILLLLAKL